MSEISVDRPRGSERIAAAIALGTFAAATILVVLVATKNIVGLFVSLLGLAVLVAGGWHAVSRRGLVRTIGILAAVVGLVLVVLGYLIVDPRLIMALVIGGLAAISVGSSRYALRRSMHALKASTPAGTRAQKPVRPVLLMNPKSGGGKVERFHLVEECRRRGIDPVVLAPGDDLLKLAEDAIARGADVIGMAGGEGSQALVASVAARHGVAHVVVPAGTRNHLALDLGLDRDDVVGALDAFVDGIERRVDLATVNGRVFVNNASLGIYAKVVQSPEYRDAKLQTAASMLPDLLGRGAEPLDLRFDGPDGEGHDTADMILVSNDPYQLDELGGRGTRERMDLGTLGIAALRVSGSGDLQRLVALDAIGRIRQYAGWTEWSTRRFEIRSGAAVELGLDGEALVMDPPLVFESMPGALRVRVPQHAPGMSPAARRFSRTTLGELVGVASGHATG